MRISARAIASLSNIFAFSSTVTPYTLPKQMGKHVASATKNPTTIFVIGQLLICTN
jgi:hypothetical protein